MKIFEGRKCGQTRINVLRKAQRDKDRRTGDRRTGDGRKEGLTQRRKARYGKNNIKKIMNENEIAKIVVDTAGSIT